MQDYIDTVDLFPLINKELINLLKTISDDEFNQATQFPSWKVKDICAHLLDTSIRRLSSGRDHYRSIESTAINSYSDLIEHVTNLADRWALAFTNVSPKILIELISKYQNELYEYFKKIKLFEYSSVSVSWAGEEKSFNWFDIAREYTERWHHQMQIREALGKKPLYERKLYFPVLDTFMKALPYHYRDWKQDKGYLLCVDITGNAGGKWYLEWNEAIELKKSTAVNPNTVVNIEQSNAWKIFTRWNDSSVYEVRVEGDKDLGEHILKMNCLLIKQNEEI
jgi:hypothetical protein